MKKVILLLLLVAPMSLFAQKFGHLNSMEIIEAMPEYTQAITELQNLAKQFEDDLRRMQEEGQKKFSEYEKERETLPANIRERRETELQQIEERIQQSYQDNQQAIQKAQQEKFTSLNAKVSKAMTEVGDAGGFVYIMDISSGTPPYINTTLSTDVTAQVKAKLGLK